MASLQLEVVTPDRKVVECVADYVGIPGIEGELGILPGHIPYLTALSIGALHYVSEGTTTRVFIAGGFAEVSSNQISILAEAAEVTAEIDKERAQQALERAQRRLAAPTPDTDMVRAQASLSRAMARLHII